MNLELVKENKFDGTTIALNLELEKSVLQKAKSHGLRCKVKKTFHGTTGLLFNKRNYICELNVIGSKNESDAEYKRVAEWIENYILYSKANKRNVIQAIIDKLKVIFNAKSLSEYWKQYATNDDKPNLNFDSEVEEAKKDLATAS